MISFVWKGIHILIVSAPIDIPELCRVRFEISWVNDVSIVFTRFRSYNLLNNSLVASKVRQTTVYTHTCSTHQYE